jgi:hypothetical protein
MWEQRNPVVHQQENVKERKVAEQDILSELETGIEGLEPTLHHLFAGGAEAILAKATNTTAAMGQTDTSESSIGGSSPDYHEAKNTFHSFLNNRITVIDARHNTIVSRFLDSSLLGLG